MNSALAPETKSRRRLGWWIAAVLGLLVITPVVVGVGIISMFRLDRPAALLRREVMAATNSAWRTKVQLSAGWAALGAIRTGLSLVEHEHVDDARLALRAVRHASVGVYECNERVPRLSRPQLLARTDEMMRRRGWTRLVGVAEGRETVMIYTVDGGGSGGCVDLCLAVLDGNELVVVSTSVEAAPLADLAARHLPKDGKLKLARLEF